MKINICFNKSSQKNIYFLFVKKLLEGGSTLRPPQNCNHMYNIFAIKFFGNVWISHFGLILLVLSIFD